MNLDKVQETRDLIALVGPSHCDMGTFVQGVATKSGRLDCGTTACVAGWTIVTSKRKLTEYDDIEHDGVASTILGCNPNRMNSLFYKDMWPEKFQDLAAQQGDQPAMLAILDAILAGRLWMDEDNFWEGPDV